MRLRVKAAPQDQHILRARHRCRAAAIFAAQIACTGQRDRTSRAEGASRNRRSSSASGVSPASGTAT